jgi:hypothetical protein
MEWLLTKAILKAEIKASANIKFIKRNEFITENLGEVEYVSLTTFGD